MAVFVLSLELVIGQIILSFLHMLFIYAQVLELQEYSVQLGQCQLVRYSGHTGILGKPFDEPKVGT